MLPLLLPLHKETPEMANTLLHDDLVAKVEPMESPQDSVVALLNTVANRIESADANPSLLNTYVKSLRDSSDEIASAVVANTPAADQNK